MLKKIKTNSYFVTIYQFNNKKIIRRKKRTGLHAYPRTLSSKLVNKWLKGTSLKYPRILINGFKYVYEEFIESTKNIDELSNKEIMDNVINYIVELNKINIELNDKKWNNNNEFLRFNINNLKDVLTMKSPEKLEIYLEELENLYEELDNSRSLCLIHGDIHKKNMIINNDNFYLIDWELAAYGDLAYELATHFILMEYSDEEKEIFIDKLCSKLSIDIKTLKRDIDVYNTFELYRRKVLSEIKK